MSSETPGSGGASPSAQESTSWVGIVAYLTIIGWVVALVAKQTNPALNTDFNRFHVRQSLGLMLASVVVTIVSGIPVLGWIVSVLGWLALLVLWILGLVGAVQQRQDPLPGVGELFQDWFRAL